MPTTSGTEELIHAVHAVTATLVALRADPGTDSVRDRIDAAERTLAVLGRDLTTIVLSRLLDSVAACHQAGQTHSHDLTARDTPPCALCGDPRWNPPIQPLPAAS